VVDVVGNIEPMVRWFLLLFSLNIPPLKSEIRILTEQIYSLAQS
jgi:hypothetical protein